MALDMDYLKLIGLVSFHEKQPLQADVLHCDCLESCSFTRRLQLRSTLFASSQYAANLNLVLVRAVRKALRATCQKMKAMSSSPARIFPFPFDGTATGCRMWHVLVLSCVLRGVFKRAETMSLNWRPKGSSKTLNSKVPDCRPR